DGAAKMGARPGKALEIGKRIEREIDFAGRAAKFVTADAFEKICGQFVRFEKFLEGEVGIDAGRDDVGGEFFTLLKGNAANSAVLCENLAHGCFGADFDAAFASGARDGLGDRARAAAAEAPGAERAVDFAHVVVKEDIGGTRRTNTEERTDDARGRHCGFERSEERRVGKAW